MTSLWLVAGALNAGVWVAISWPHFQKRAPFPLLVQSVYVAAASPFLLMLKIFNWATRRES